jgi:[ribosomal protein S18]-alanine N-acetyltransferase
MSFDAAKIEIRSLEAADLDTILGIAEILEDAPHWSLDRYEEVLRMDSPRSRIGLVAWEPRSREVIGFAVASLVTPEAELESIAVAAREQRRGVGRRLLEVLGELLWQRGVAELLLEVRASNAAAIAFYQSQNFRQVGIRPGYYADPEEDAVLMALRLS